MECCKKGEELMNFEACLEFFLPLSGPGVRFIKLFQRVLSRKDKEKSDSSDECTRNNSLMYYHESGPFLSVRSRRIHEADEKRSDS